MYTRIPNEKEENILRVRGQESWASTMLIGSIHDSNILIESILIGSIRIGSILIGTSESVAYSIQSDALEKCTTEEWYSQICSSISTWTWRKKHYIAAAKI